MAERDDDDMALPAGETCGSCAHWRRCKALIQTLCPSAAYCDFSPSRFRPKEAPHAD